MKINFKKGFTQLQRAFTLIELLVVISIIGILVTLSFVGFMQARKSARDSQRKANIEQIRSALEIYRTDCKTYPVGNSLDDLKSATPASCVNEVYMSEIPSDPIAGNSYVYSGFTNTYTLCAYLETVTAAGALSCSNCDATGGTCNYLTKNP